MNNLKKQSYSQLKTRRDLMLNAKAFSIDDEDRASFQKAIEGLEEEMYQRQITTVRSMLIAVSILVLISIFASGCISNTLDGMRQDIHNASRPGDQAKWTK